MLFLQLTFKPSQVFIRISSTQPSQGHGRAQTLLCKRCLLVKLELPRQIKPDTLRRNSYTIRTVVLQQKHLDPSTSHYILYSSIHKVNITPTSLLGDGPSGIDTSMVGLVTFGPKEYIFVGHLKVCMSFLVPYTRTLLDTKHEFPGLKSILGKHTIIRIQL